MVDIIHRIGVTASRGAVYDALTTRGGLGGWWTEDVSGDPRIGGLIKFRFDNRGRIAGEFTMKVLDARSNELVSWEVVEGPPEWIRTEVRFELYTDGDFTILVFRQNGWREPVEFMNHCSTRWAVFLMSLKQLVETG